MFSKTSSMFCNRCRSPDIIVTSMLQKCIRHLSHMDTSASKISDFFIPQTRGKDNLVLRHCVLYLLHNFGDTVCWVAVASFVATLRRERLNKKNIIPLCGDRTQNRLQSEAMPLRYEDVKNKTWYKSCIKYVIAIYRTK